MSAVDARVAPGFATGSGSGSGLNHEDIADRLSEMIALLEALEQAEFLSEAPERAGARARHQLGSSLLTLLARQLRELRAAVADPAVGVPADDLSAELPA
ncbi:hypothetical protein LRS10_15610 [Phenylobacterium sp. J426]|uniref:hypothetical protein n=1 Tax=Phenylobacterium sp. J426 TaxID=2898439 RepID=UPI0021517369|nr:hypothetical protein [Phenylobacterium sp. J426]MCR5875480.1 hypothetical protein [Phenylobacterium sp. J426]